MASRQGHSFYSFPTIESLVGVVSEAALRGAGFGYRAKSVGRSITGASGSLLDCRYVKGSIEEVGRRGGRVWLSSLRQLSYEEAWTQLQQLSGVGAKVPL